MIISSELFEDFRLPVLTNFTLTPFYNSSVLYNNQNKVGSFGTYITPSFTVPIGSARHFAVFNYTMQASIYEALSRNNTVNNTLSGTTSFEFTARHRLTLTGRGAFGYDPLGTLFSQGDIANVLRTPNQWMGYNLGGVYQYGAPGARGHLDFKFDFMNREYTNNLALTRQRDVNSYNLGVAFLWRFMPKTQLLFEVNDTIMDYYHQLNTGGNLNGSVYRIYTGATWVPTTKTRVALKFGYQYRQFEDPSLQGKGGPAFQTMVGWSPRSRDNLSLQFSNAFDEAQIAGSSTINTQNIGANWSHTWLERFNTNLGAFFMNQDYVGNNIQNQTIRVMTSANYQFRYNINAALEYLYSNRLSNEAQFSYDQNMVMLRLNTNF